MKPKTEKDLLIAEINALLGELRYFGEDQVVEKIRAILSTTTSVGSGNESLANLANK